MSENPGSEHDPYTNQYGAHPGSGGADVGGTSGGDWPASGQGPGSGPADPAERVRRQVGRGGVGCVVLGIAVVVLLVWLYSMGNDGDVSFTDDDSALYSASKHYRGVPLPSFSEREQQRLSKGLAELEKTYDMCFGWTLTDGSLQDQPQWSERDDGRHQALSYGSSRGADVRATSCDRWAEVRVSVGYTSSSSADYDAADISLVTSNHSDVSPQQTRQAFAQLGIDADALISDPVGTTGHAALAAPLLLVQRGELEPATGSTGQSASDNPSRSLPGTGGSDFPTGTVVILALIGAGAVGAVAMGVRTRRRQE